MTNLEANLRDRAVAWVATQVTAGTDVQEIEWCLLNLEEFAPLMHGKEGDELHEYLADIIQDGEEEAEEAAREEMEGDARRYEEYLIEYPELERPWWETER